MLGRPRLHAIERLRGDADPSTDSSGRHVARRVGALLFDNAVKAYLLKKGLKEARVESKGFGSSQPIADNNSESGRSKNRRVEIVLGE